MLRHSAQAMLEQLAREAQAAAERTEGRLRRTQSWADAAPFTPAASTAAAANPWAARGEPHEVLLTEAQDEIDRLALLLPAAAASAACQPG